MNVLIYAFRQDSALHARCKTWLDSVVTADSRFGVSPLALSAVVRMTTNPRAFFEPSTLEEAFGFCDDLLTQPHCVIVAPGNRHWSIFKGLCVQGQMRGAMTSDAWFAALAIEQGCTWVTCDRDFARFPGLDWRAP